MEHKFVLYDIKKLSEFIELIEQTSSPKLNQLAGKIDNFINLMRIQTNHTNSNERSGMYSLEQDFYDPITKLGVAFTHNFRSSFARNCLRLHIKTRNFPPIFCIDLDIENDKKMLQDKVVKEEFINYIVNSFFAINNIAGNISIVSPYVSTVIVDVGTSIEEKKNLIQHLKLIGLLEGNCKQGIIFG